MKSGESYVKDANDFHEKLKKLGKIPKGAILVTADISALYSNISHKDG